MTNEQISNLSRYAAEHTRDCGGDRAMALREMSDEPGEVALACGCTVAEAQAWIADRLEDDPAHTRQGGRVS